MIGPINNSAGTLAKPVSPPDPATLTRTILGTAVSEATDQVAKMAKVGAALLATGEGALPAPTALLDVYA